MTALTSGVFQGLAHSGHARASLSLQKHHHRAEHWIVVTGKAEITNGDRVLTLTENQSTYIPLGEVHRLVTPDRPSSNHRG